MQRNGFKINEAHINMIALKSRLDNRECGYLYKRVTDTKWQIKWFVLYQNLLFYYENVNSIKPLGFILLESCYCNRILSNHKNTKEGEVKLYCFSLSYTKDGKDSMEFGTESEQECMQWIESINNCSYNKQISQYTELQEKYVHLTQLYDTETKSKWEYLSQIQELSNEVKQLREELKRYQKQHFLLRSKTIADEDSEDMKRIKKVQSLCRGWLYRRRWKRIVKEYIDSPHAMNLRKRNRIVFELVEKEGEYLSQLEILVSNFLRPFKMAASSTKPPITHEEINCIFLNSEILLFLHQIFYKGLVKKLDHWPSLFVGDIFDFLLPVLVVYQEYVRNHHYSLQILTELKSKSPDFRNLLKRYEEKSKCEGRSLDVWLTYPMHQIPRYIIILHQLIIYTSQYSTNELKCLENAKVKLEELSKSMHDEVSETENIRYNLAIEKQIVEGCEVLLDANQVFIREGLLIVLTSIKSKALGVKLKDVKKRHVVKCFLFTNHLILTTRASNGRLNMFKPSGIMPLNECKLIEEIVNEGSLNDDENGSIISEDCSVNSGSMYSAESTLSLFYNSKDQPADFNCHFKIIQTSGDTTRSIIFKASSLSEKESWCSDISQCIDNLNYSGLFQNSNSVNMPNRSNHFDDPKLFNDDKEIKYCKVLNSCKVPQIRQATVDKLMERLTDLRFLSIDFLNTFLLTYRVFTDCFVVLNALVNLYRSSPKGMAGNLSSNNELNRRISYSGIYRLPSINEEQSLFPHRNTLACLNYGDCKSEGLKHMLNDSRTALAPLASIETIKMPPNLINRIPEDEEASPNESITPVNLSEKSDNSSRSNTNSKSNFFIEDVVNTTTKANVVDGLLSSNSASFKVPSIAKPGNFQGKPSSQSYLSFSQNDITDSGISVNGGNSFYHRKDNRRIVFEIKDVNETNDDSDAEGYKTSNLASSNLSLSDSIDSASNVATKIKWKESPGSFNFAEHRLSQNTEALSLSPATTPKRKKNSEGATSANQLLLAVQQNAQKISRRLTDAFTLQKINTKLIEASNKKMPANVFAGVVVTSSRSSRRRISNIEAAKAFAVATSGSISSASEKSLSIKGSSFSTEAPTSSFSKTSISNQTESQKSNNDWIIVNTAASMRVLNILRHWCTKHPLDFFQNEKFKNAAIELVDEILNDPQITEAEQKVAQGIIQQLNSNYELQYKSARKLDSLLAGPSVSGRIKFNDLSVSEIAEQMTFIDYQIFCSISGQEFLSQAWMKPGKEKNAPNILLLSKRFNEMSQLVVSEIVSSEDFEERIQKLEKWTTIANICKFLKNYNGVLQVMSAFASTSIFRLKKTWEKLSKNSKQTVDNLQNLVSSDGRFKNLRDAMHKSDPPCIPYLGMYLNDLVFIEESMPDLLEGNLINFSKFRMVSHIIRDIRSFQCSKYTIHHNRRVCEFLLDTSNLLNSEDAYNKSLTMEPRASVPNSTAASVAPTSHHFNLRKSIF